MNWHAYLSTFVLSFAFATSAVGQLERVDDDVEIPDISVDELTRAVEKTGARPRLIDVRLAEDFEADPVLIPDASWRDPNAIESWVEELSPGETVIVYCVAGRWVSRSVTKKLLDMGLDVSQLAGGIEAWKAAGKPTAPSKDP